MTMKCKEKEISTSCYIQNCADTMLKAFIISKSKKHQSNSLMDIMSYILPSHVSKAPTCLSIEFLHFTKFSTPI
jgi:hypothetical protein